MSMSQVMEYNPMTTLTPSSKHKIISSALWDCMYIKTSHSCFEDEIDNHISIKNSCLFRNKMHRFLNISQTRMITIFIVRILFVRVVCMYISHWNAGNLFSIPDKMIDNHIHCKNCIFNSCMYVYFMMECQELFFRCRQFLPF